MVARAAQEIHSLKPAIQDGLAKCAVSCDGTWQRRGFSFSNGCVTAISMDTGKVLDVEPLSKVCKKCREHVYLLLLRRETQAFVLRMLWRW